MQLCWSTHESRPSITQIDVMLCDLLEVCKNTNNTSQNPSVSVDDFDSRWEMLKPNTIVKTDNQTMETDDDLDVASYIEDKQISPSLNNLLDDGTSVNMESWLENVAEYGEEMPDVVKKTDAKPSDIKFKEGLKVEFKLCPMSQRVARSAEVLNDRTSSESETEDENWKRKIERGAYSEKVRQKSRSVTDLMILTHIDCSESDSETPLPSIDYKANFYKNVRYAPRQNLENVSLMFGSEGNLLSVQDTFQQELQKLREERKDSLLFVPENINNDISSVANRRILEELNSTSEIKPANQVFNVFNVTVSPKYNFNNMPKLKQTLRSDDCAEEESQQSVNIISDSNSIEDGKLCAELKCEGNAPDLIADLPSKENNTDFSCEEDHSVTLPSPKENSKEEIAGDETITMQELIIATKDFLNKEKHYNSAELTDKQATEKFLEAERLHSNEITKIKFDLSENQQSIQPNSLTHSMVFTSSPFVKKQMENSLRESGFTSLNLFECEQLPVEADSEGDNNLTYSIETWDNFLEKTFESQEECFSSFNSEPQSIVFIENSPDGDCQKDLNTTYVIEESVGENEDTVKEMTSGAEISVIDECNGDVDEASDGNEIGNSLVAGQGWFLHPQSNEEVSGEMEVSEVGNSASYVGFSMDDEIMAAIRNELLQKLPHAQVIFVFRSEKRTII